MASFFLNPELWHSHHFIRHWLSVDWVTCGRKSEKFSRKICWSKESGTAMEWLGYEHQTQNYDSISFNIGLYGCTSSACHVLFASYVGMAHHDSYRWGSSILKTWKNDLQAPNFELLVAGNTWKFWASSLHMFFLQIQLKHKRNMKCYKLLMMWNGKK